MLILSTSLRIFSTAADKKGDFSIIALLMGRKLSPLPRMREWWNWQTHHLEGVAPGRACEFKSRLAHKIFRKTLTFSEVLAILRGQTMATIRLPIITVAAAFLLYAVAVAGVLRIGSFQATSDGVNVTLHWVTDDETNVAHFEIQRMSGINGVFMPIATLDPKGPSAYEYVDNTAFQRITSLYQYRIKIVHADASAPEYSATVTVSHTVSGVRRTWGSIKSMSR